MGRNQEINSYGLTGLPVVRSLFGGLDHQVNPSDAIVQDQLLCFLDSTDLKKGKEEISRS